MSQPIDREGNFQAQITEYGLREEESGSVSLAITANILAMWDGEAWQDWTGYDVTAEGFLCLVKKDRTLNKSQVNPLCQFAGWDGDFTKLASQEWAPTPCQIKVQSDTYEGKTRLRISFLNDLNRVPGQKGNVDEAKAKALQARFGGEMRAVVGNLRRNAVAPGSAPPPTPPAPVHVPASLHAGEEDIPF